jgi:hypothetical protein
MSDISKHPFDTEATQAEIDEYMKIAAVPGASAEFIHEWELSHGYRVRDSMNPERLHEVVQPTVEAPKTMSVKVGDQVFTANTTEELAAISERAIQAAIAARTGDVARNANGTFAKQPSVTDGADKITNGLVTRALQEELGIKPEELQAAVAGIRENNNHTSSWAMATKEFLNRNPDYKGDEGTKDMLARKIQELGLAETPSVASIQRAYDALSEEAERYLKVQDAKSPQEIRDALGITQREQGRLRYGR